MQDSLLKVIEKLDGFSTNVSSELPLEQAFDILEPVRTKGSLSVSTRNLTAEVLIDVCNKIETTVGNPDVIFYLPFKKFAGVFHSNLRWTFANLKSLIEIDSEQLAIVIPAKEGRLYFDFTPFGEFDAEPGYAIFAHGENLTSIVRPLVFEHIANY